MGELKDCPFCGSKAEVIDYRLVFVVQCLSCSATVIGNKVKEEDTEDDRTNWDEVKQTAVNKWNTRKGF